MFRDQAARDFGCLLDLDPTIDEWTCLPTVVSQQNKQHVPDFAARSAVGITLIDVGDHQPSELEWLSAVAQKLCLTYRFVSASEFQGSIRLSNARDLLRYAHYSVSLGDRVRLLAALNEAGSLHLGSAVEIMRSSKDPVGAIASLVLQRFVRMDIDVAPIGPDTLISRAHS